MKLEGKNVKLRKFGPGDHFGEMTVCGLKNARVTAVAETDGDCVIVPATGSVASWKGTPRSRSKSCGT